MTRFVTVTRAAQPFVRLERVTKRFGPLLANDALNLSFYEGEVLALLGENGAGKSTVSKILFGLYRADEGEVFVSGSTVQFRSPADAIQHGIGFVSQHFSLVPRFTVAENVVLGREGSAVLDRRGLERRVGALSDEYGLGLEPGRLVSELSVGEQQRVEILKALYQECRLLILDEPTAVLTPADTERFFGTLRTLQAQGLSVVIITHKLHEVMAVSQRVAVLRGGRLVGERLTHDTTETELARLMVGRDTAPVTRQAVRGKTEHSDPSTVLDVRGLRYNDRGRTKLSGVSFSVGAGEVVGVAGVAGNGQSELVAALSGMLTPTSGTVAVAGESITDFSPVAFLARGVGRIPEDRFGGVVGELTVAENLALEHLGSVTRGGYLERRKLRQEAEKLITAYSIKAKPGDRVRTLSGGNVQKIILARVLSRNPKLVVAAGPTRGLDVGAAAYVQEKLLAAASAGAAVLLVSDDLDEIMRLSSRILVMFRGEVTGDFAAGEADAETLSLRMAGNRTGADYVAA